ncbi:MAG: hypothetical protein AMJ88_17920 [Anaerolineae bacterium SM23_ 63]|nr:MAG: hypothetical protein AMJ88_17920 [Anaerolineae bacterium SM23_ 63]
MTWRPLSQSEIEQAQLVFKDALAYERVRVYEEVAWSLRIAQFGAWLSHSTAPSNNAVTLGNRIFFSRELSTDSDESSSIFLNDMCWLMHELTHVWQYQHDGWIYLFEALWVQLKFGPDAYGYGWEAGLIEAIAQNKKFRDFNREQQGDIVKHYYYRHKQGLDTSAWQPFIAEVQVV